MSNPKKPRRYKKARRTISFLDAIYLPFSRLASRRGKSASSLFQELAIRELEADGTLPKDFKPQPTKAS